jgi:hypothetical protein
MSVQGKRRESRKPTTFEAMGVDVDAHTQNRLSSAG